MLTFSDLQADIVAELIRNNVAVHAFNQRDIAGIFDMIRTLGAIVGATRKAEAAGEFPRAATSMRCMNVRCTLRAALASISRNGTSR